MQTIPSSAMPNNIFESSEAAASTGPVSFVEMIIDKIRKTNPSSKELDITKVDVPTPTTVPADASAGKFQSTTRPEKSRRTAAVSKYSDGGAVHLDDPRLVRAIHQTTARPGIPTNIDKIPTSSSGNPIASPENHIQII
jgi:hypothetical protein